MGKIVWEKLKGFTFIVRPTVFNPVDFISSKVFISYINTLDLNSKHILDMGSGSGVVSIIAASRGAQCIAADINPVAIRCITENALQNKFSGQITAIESDLFESLRNTYPAKFDIIFFNPPYYKGSPHNNFERAFKGGPNLEVIDRFLEDAKNFLAPSGRLCLLVSSDMDLDDLYNRVRSAGYSYKIIHTNKKPFETFYIIDAVIQ
ncbi:MAG TPA: methyltransferase [Ignavibacteria bacterium]|nr:methyltransferase [Ignavibacteria bacterium]HMQ98960.1 methyltransferase [Ignavibacteria bacterium]